MSFRFTYWIDYNDDLNYDDISTTTNVVARAADETTAGDREAWELGFHRNEVRVAFGCECCRDRFIGIYECLAQEEQDDNSPSVARKRISGRSRPTSG